MVKKINGRGKKALKKLKVKGVVQEPRGRSSLLDQKAETVKHDLATKANVASP